MLRKCPVPRRVCERGKESGVRKLRSVFCGARRPNVSFVLDLVLSEDMFLLHVLRLSRPTILQVLIVFVLLVGCGLARYKRCSSLLMSAAMRGAMTQLLGVDTRSQEA